MNFNLKMFFSKFSDKFLCATWFGGVALLFVLPWSVFRFLSIQEWSVEYALFAVYLEGMIPATMAAFFGAYFGTPIVRQGSTLSEYQSFVLGVKISIASAFTWLIIGFLSIIGIEPFLDASRFAGGIVINAIFGFPFYGVFAGLGGISLRMLAVRSCRI